MGEHAGPWNFTIGQGAKVKGLKEKTFVVKKDTLKNIIYVVPGTSVFIISSFEFLPSNNSQGSSSIIRPITSHS